MSREVCRKFCRNKESTLWATSNTTETGLTVLTAAGWISIPYSLPTVTDCGLLIIDEAQLFLNKESLRYDRLTKLRSEKIVILTATPIKTSEVDLHTYVSIAGEILGNPQLDENWIEEIGTEGKDVDSLICSKFDETYPVTRYFKDTIMSINVEGYEKKQARRLIPQLWEFFDENAIEMDSDLLREDPEKAMKDFKREISDRLKEYEEAFNDGQLSNEKVLEIIRSLGDKVFYQTNGELHTIDAIEECGKIISNNPKFREYKDNFAQNVKLPLLVSKYAERFNF